MPLQISHSPQGSPLWGWRQLTALAKIFAQVVLPVPRTPAAMQALIRALINQDYQNSEGLIFRHVRRVTAETEEDISWTLDGEYAPGAPRIEIGIEESGIAMLL